ncbi:hypothetical protein [Lagierella sp.]|uniref:hypothetical protein n=1 Tax=Lagierella sp. TaxID=2849657 RepID=UPI00261BE66C|nr:hypothetical protein [Lagierella sp.]
MKKLFKFTLGFISILIIGSCYILNGYHMPINRSLLIADIDTKPIFKNRVINNPVSKKLSLFGDRTINKGLLLNAPNHLKIGTYIKTDDQAIHPSIVYDPQARFGYRYIMAFTPYSFLNDQTENPSIVVSHDGIHFEDFPGLTNPISLPEKHCHLSDVSLFFRDDTLELWYRVSNKKTRLSKLVRKTSKNLKDFSPEETIFDFGTGGYGYGAPTILYEDGWYKIYYRKNMNIGEDAYVFTQSKDLKEFTPPIPLEMTKGEWSNYNPWHLEIKKVEDRYYCLSMDCPDGKMESSALFVSESSDGIHFENPIEVLCPCDKGYDDWLIYKSTFIVKDNRVLLYYSSIDKLKRSYISLLTGPDFLNLSPVN